MSDPVSLVETPEPLTSLESDPSVEPLLSLFARGDLLGKFAALITGKRPPTLADLFSWVIDSLPMHERSALPKLASEAEASLERYFASEGLREDGKKVGTLSGLVLQYTVTRYLSMRLGRGLRRDVKVWIEQRQVRPRANNIDCGYADSSKGQAEFYECKTSPTDLLGAYDRPKAQLILLLNIHDELSRKKWDVVCAVPTLMLHSSTSRVFGPDKIPPKILPVGREFIPQLATRRPPFS